MDYTVKTRLGTVYQRVTWTGGNTPSVRDKQNTEFKAIRSTLFREQLSECLGLDFWPDTTALERARIFWNRATLDAWRTLTDRKRG